MNTSKHSRPMVRQFAQDYLVVSLVPVLMLLVLMVGGALIAKGYLADLIRESIHDLNRDAELHLEQIGQKIIQAKAIDVAQQIAIYLNAHPDVPMKELQSTSEFKRIALQKVGRTGYTCLYEARTGVMRIHPNRKLIDRDMHFLAEELPSWWTIFEPTLAGVEVSGYYDWLEADGSVRRKFMTMTPVPENYRNRTLMIAATTYIDEFSSPIAVMKTKAEEITTHYQNYVQRQGILVGGATLAFLLFAFASVYVFGRRAALRYILPIDRLAKAAKRLGEGEWEPRDDPEMLRRSDEIGALAREFNSMRSQLKRAFNSLEQRLTELRQTQAALKQSEEHYRSLFDGVPVGIYRTTPDGRIADANPTLVRMLGYPDRDSLIAQNASNLYFHPDDRLDWKDRVERETGYDHTEIQMRRHQKNIIWVEDYSRSVHDEEGRVIYYEGSLKDITERKRAEEDLRESEEKYRQLYGEAKRAEEVYRSLLNSSADAIAIYDLEGKTKYVSPAFTSLFGWMLEELENRPVPFVPESEKEASFAAIRELIDQGKPFQGFETKRCTKSGRLVDVSISASRYDDHSGNPAGMLVLIRDISKRKRLEAQLVRAQKMEAIGTLAGGIAHDFNNMMMGILGSVSLMLHNTDSSHPHHDNLKRIEDLIHSASRLTGQLLGYARKGKFEVRPIDVNQLVRESTETFGRTRKEIEIHLELSPDPLTIEADKSQIEQILMNLFINASDAMPKGGVLSVITADMTHREIRSKPYTPKPGNYLLLRVQDSGIGMDHKTMERIFDPFFTTKEMGRGTGLGLASVYGIVKGHGGYIDVESNIDHGTAFNLYLPATDKQVRVSAKTAEPIKKGEGTILLVDDEETVIDVGAKMLEHLGFKVLIARNGEEAVNLYTENKTSIDLVVLDMIMPGMGGGEAYDTLKEIDPDIKVILSSGYSLDGQAGEIMARGCDGFIQKPFDVGQLSRKIHEVFNALV
jgi:two-component system cell cycle sensor histidine kinase/response regulator CckA